MKLLLFDMDGTLLHRDHTISSYTVSILKQAKEKGVLLGACTGRPSHHLRHFFSQYGLENDIDIYISLNGVELVSFPLDYHELLYWFDGKWIPSLIQGVKDLGLEGSFITYNETDFWMSPYDQELHDFYKEIYPMDHVHEDKDLQSFYEKRTWKINFRRREPFTDEELDLLATLNNENYHGFCTGSQTYEFVNAKASKANGLKKIAKMHGIPLEEVVMFGDGGNDIDVMKISGIAVAVKNARESVLASSDEVTESNEDDGVAKWIERYVL